MAKFEIVGKKIEKASGAELYKEGIQAYENKVAEDNNLIAAYKAKKLKSKNLIRKARRLIKERERTRAGAETAVD